MTVGKDNTVRILFLGGAKRVAMANLFVKALESKGFGCEIFGYELDCHCPLASVGTVIEGLKWSDAAIFDDISSVCLEHSIDIVIPFVDPAVSIAAELTSRYCPDVFAPVSDRKLSEIMFDKKAAAELFEQHGFPIPITYRTGAPAGHLIAKPRFGSASKGLVMIDGLKELYEMQSCLDRYLVQERIDNKEEYTVDCYVSLRDGRVLAISPRLRREVSGGEVVGTETVSNHEIETITRRVLAQTGLKGAVTVQFIRDLDTDRYLVMEINPRLGGGCVASVYAGADIPALIVEDAMKLDTYERFARHGVQTTRYPADVVFYPET